MIPIWNLYDAVKGQSNTETTGWVDDNLFNAFLRASENELLDFLTGRVLDPPAPFLRKNEDWLLPFRVTKKGNMRNSVVAYPSGYFHHQSLLVKTEEGKWEEVDVTTPPIAQNRRSSDIEAVAKGFYGATQDNGVRIYADDISTEYEFNYYRYPVYGKYGSKEDIYKDLVYDSAKSKDLEWPQVAEYYFIWKINQYINKRNREGIAAQINTI